MFYLHEYTNRVTQQEDGAYRWRSTVEKEYEQRSYTMTKYICVGIAAFMLLFGGLLGLQYGAMEAFLPVVFSVVVFLIISFGICWIMEKAPGPYSEIYELTDTYVKTGSGRTSAYFHFSKAKEVIVSPKFIELKGTFGGPRVYASEEDMPFVKGWIMSRIPGTATIHYHYG